MSEGKTAARVKTGKHGLARVTGGRGTATRAMAMLRGLFVRGRSGVEARQSSPWRCAPRLRTAPATHERFGICSPWRGAKDNAADCVACGNSGDEVSCLTGWRRGEVLALNWAEVDLVTRTARLSDTKTGASLRPLSRAACEVLRELPHLGALVFPASAGADKPMRGFHKVWLRVGKHAALAADVTPHVLRHSFASLASDLGYSEPTIAALIGHKGRTITSRYVHSADAVLLAAADAVAERTAELMGEARASGVVIELPKRAS